MIFDKKITPESAHLFTYTLLLIATIGMALKLGAHNTSENAAVAKDDLANEQIATFLAKPQFTKTGLFHFFQSRFNNPRYATFLSRSFVHIADFLEYARTTNKPIEFVIKTFNIFNQRLKECTWINVYALLALTEEFAKQLPHYCNASKEASRAEQIEKELTRLFEKNRATYAKKPEIFFQQAARSLDTTLTPAQEKIDALELQLRVTKFLEEAISKLIWNPHDQAEIWRTISALTAKLEELYHLGIIASTDDLNLLIWTLVYRLGYFIDCAGSQVGNQFFASMSDDLAQNKLPVFMLQEQEEFLLKKMQYLESLVARGRAKVAAAQAGIFVDGIL